MRADSHDGPELRLHPEAEYIDAALTFVSPPTSSCDARPDHTSWHISDVALQTADKAEADIPWEVDTPGSALDRSRRGRVCCHGRRSGAARSMMASCHSTPRSGAKPLGFCLLPLRC